MMRYHGEVNADAAIVRKCLIDEFISLNPNFSAKLTTQIQNVLRFNFQRKKPSLP